jgi:hypothetical protein
VKRYAVKLRAGVTDAERLALESRFGIAPIRRIAPLRVAIYDLPEATARAIAHEPEVELVEEERGMTAK